MEHFVWAFLAFFIGVWAVWPLIKTIRALTAPASGMKGWLGKLTSVGLVLILAFAVFLALHAETDWVHFLLCALGALVAWYLQLDPMRLLSSDERFSD